MLKQIIATTLVAGTLVFSGCGSTDTEGAALLKAQSSLDRGDYSTAIATLEAKTDKTDEDNIILGSAYMGEAGFSVVDIVSYIFTEPVDPSQDRLSTFTANITSNITDVNESIANLTTAIVYFEAVVGTDANVSSVEEVTDTQLKLGLAYMVKVSILLDDVGSDDTETATTINSAFSFISSIGSAELTQSIDDMKLEAFGGTGEITAAMIDTYQASL